ncbi:MAG: hypothetical protein M3N97_10810 [Pseudomonadota bacterium]|nr:hypothetical protein [Pseudomonadota bacterium]
MPIPANDLEAIDYHPAHRWVYDRLLVAKTQGLPCGTADEAPILYPVFCRPRTSLRGLGRAGRILLGEGHHHEHCGADEFWMRRLIGDRLSTDFAVVEGDIAWCRHALGMPDAAGALDYWVIEERSRPQLERYCRQWIAANLAGYTGMLNLVTLGGRIIDTHLRFADRWADLYGRKWLEAVARLYEFGTWDLIDAVRAEGYSVVLSGPADARPDPEVLARYESTVGISSVRLTFTEGVPQARVPPGTFRLAAINCFNLDVGRRVRAALARELNLAAEVAPTEAPYRRTLPASLSANALNA